MRSARRPLVEPSAPGRSRTSSARSPARRRGAHQGTVGHQGTAYRGSTQTSMDTNRRGGRCMKGLAFRTASCLALLIIAVSAASAQDGAASYKQNCASCHDAGVDRAPNREALQSMTAERVLAALESGAMISMASRSSAAERRAIAQFVTGKALSKSDVDMTPAPRSMCAAAGSFTDPLTGPLWNGWGENTSNTRFQDG